MPKNSIRMFVGSVLVIVAACAPAQWTKPSRMFARSPRGSVITGVIHGNGSLTPLAGATVVVAGGDSTITDTEGRFTLRGVPRGAVSVTARRPGFYDFTLREFTVASDTLHYAAELHPNPATRLQPRNPLFPESISLVRASVDSVTAMVGFDTAFLNRQEKSIESIAVLKRPRAGQWFGPSAAGGVAMILMRPAKDYPFSELPFQR